jgi:hypothetical protein
VSTEVEDSTVVRAALLCPECIESEKDWRAEAMAARELVSVEGYSLEPSAANRRSLRGWQQAYAAVRAANGG